MQKMSEDSLLDTQTPATDTPAPTEQSEAAYYWAENVAAEGEKPEWYMADKYKSVADQAAAYPELAKKLGSFNGAPEEYTIAFPEDPDGNPLGEYIEGDTMLESFKETARELNMSQEGFTKLLHAYTNWQIDGIEATRANEVEKLGENREARINAVTDWGKANLSEEEFGMLKDTLVTADAFRVAEILIDKTREKAIPANVNPAPGYTIAEYRAAVADPRYQTDADFRNEALRKLAAIKGQGEHHEVRG